MVSISVEVRFPFRLGGAVFILAYLFFILIRLEAGPGQRDGLLMGIRRSGIQFGVMRGNRTLC